MKSIFILSLLCFAFVVSAQNNSPENNSSTPQSEISISIRGIVVDSLARSSVQGATVSLFVKGYTSPFQGVFSDKDGHFVLASKIKEVSSLKVSFIGYKDKTILISQKQLESGNVDLGNIYLASTGVQLQTVTITTNVPEMVVKEDTIEYNAAAFKVPQNAVVEDLLKRLPGVEVDKDGKITTTSGKEVKRVYVDGKRFFGDDPKMATKNLTADIVDKVQVVDKKSDLAQLTGVDDDDSETVINITIKKGMKQGWMGNLTGGAGKFLDNKQENDPRYNTSVMLNRFRDNNQFSFIVNANNINNRASTDRGNNVRTGRGAGGGNGITTSNNFGVNWATELNNKLKIEASTSYNYSDDYSNSKSFQQSTFSATNKSYKNSASQSRSYSNNYALEGRLEYAPDKNTTVRMGTNFSYNTSLSNSASDQSTRSGDKDSTLVNSSNGKNRLSSSGTEVRLQMDASRKLSETGRRISLSGTYSTNHSNGNGSNNSITNYYQALSENRKLDQRSNSNSNRDSYNFRTDYVEPLSKNTFLNFSYSAQFNNTSNQRLTYDRDTTAVIEKYDILNPAYSRSSETNTVNQSIRAAFRGQFTKYTYSFGIDVSPVHTKSKTYVKDWFGQGNDSILNLYKGRTTVNYAPQLEFVYRFDDKSKTDSTSIQGVRGGGERAGGFSPRRGGYGGGSRNSLRFRYNGRTDQPSVTQLDPTPNNTNPLRISSGNPELLPSFTHRITLEYSKFNMKNQSSLNATLNLSFVNNGIVNYTTYIDSTGGQSTKPVNINGSWNMNSSLMWAKPFGESNRFRFSTQSNVSYRNQVGFTRVDTISVKNITRNLGINQGVNLSYTNDWFYGQLRAQVNYTNISYNLGSTNGRKSYVYNLSYNMQITMPYSWTLSSDISYSANRGLTAGYNQDEILWNAELGKTVLSKGYLSFKVTDILRQKLNLSRSVTDNSITDSQYTALTSYAMVSFTYRFANMGGKGRGRRVNFQGGGMEMGRPDGPPYMGM